MKRRRPTTAQTTLHTADPSKWGPPTPHRTYFDELPAVDPAEGAEAEAILAEVVAAHDGFLARYRWFGEMPPEGTRYKRAIESARKRLVAEKYSDEIDAPVAPIPDRVEVDVYDLSVILDAKGPWMADTDDFDVVERLRAALKAPSADARPS